MKHFDFPKYRDGFLHWKGWTTFGHGCKSAWLATICWNGWEKLFFLPLSVSVCLLVLCVAGLIWIFLQGMEQTIGAYGIYVLSAYSLTTLCVRLPSAIRKQNNWREKHPKVDALLKDTELKFKMDLYREQIINFGYGIYKITSGVVIGSAWIGCDGIYNMAQALIQLFQILRRRKPGSIQKQWKSYRLCGTLILLMHLTIIGIVFQMVNWNRVEESGEIMIIATATFAFYKFISSFINIAKDRKHKHPIDSSVRMLELSQAFFAMFSLQAGLLHTFGTGDDWEHYMNFAVGCIVCFLTVAMGIYMIRRANRELKSFEERIDGKQVL